MKTSVQALSAFHALAPALCLPWALIRGQPVHPGCLAHLSGLHQTPFLPPGCQKVAGGVTAPSLPILGISQWMARQEAVFWAGGARRAKPAQAERMVMC